MTSSGPDEGSRTPRTPRARRRRAPAEGAVTPTAPPPPPITEAELILPPPDVEPVGFRRGAVTFGKRFLTGLRDNAPRTAVSAAVGGAIGWLANVMVMAGKYDGYVVPPGTTASGQGNVARGASFWFVASMVISAVVNYRIMVGSERFWAELRGFPSTIRSLVRDDGNAALTHALFGFAGATVITYALGPSLSGALAVGVVVAIGTVLRPFLVGSLLLAWRWVVKRVAPQSTRRTPVQAVTVTTLGGAAAMALAVVVGGMTTRLVLGVGAAVAAVLLSQRERSGTATAMLLLLTGLGSVVALVLAGADAAFADDGGWRECGQSLGNWWNCSGSDRARWLAVYGAGGSGLGAGLGSGLLPTEPRPPLPKAWSEMTPEEQARFRQDYINRFKETHPNATGAQMKRFIEGLDAQPPGFWEKRWEGVKNFLGAYWDDVSSGQQAEGLGALFVGGYEGFTEAASTTWNELKQLPGTLAELPGVMDEDFNSGAQLKRIEGMIETAGKAIDAANAIINMSPEELQAAYDKYGKEAVQGFMAKMGDFERSLQGKSPTEIRQAIGKLAGAAEFEILLGAAGDKGMKMSKQGLAFLQEARYASKMDEAVAGVSQAAKNVPKPTLSPEILKAREELFERAKHGPVKISAEEADRLLGLDEKILLERQGTILQYGEGKAARGATTQYKLGDENSIMAKQLRTEHPDVWTGKWNPVSDKSYVPGEEALMSAEDLLKFKEHPPLPGETVNYKPKQLSPQELEQLPPEVQSRYLDRAKDAGEWDKHTGFGERKAIDYSDPKIRAKYGEMYVPEDPSKPVKAAEFWKDPADNRVYVRYQTEDGTWSPPRRQASDIDTVTHSGGEKLTYKQSSDLQQKQSMGQIGEGDTPTWVNSMLKDGPGGAALKDPAMKDSLYKGIDALHKANGQQVVEQSLDGYVLKTANYQAELDRAAQAAKALDVPGGWTPEQRAALVAKGILK